MELLLPQNEQRRLEILRQYEILDTPAEDRFDSIVIQAAEQFYTPIALFTLVDGDRQWFKSRVGLDAQQTERTSSFCSHAIAIDAPLVVEDASKNNLFARNPLVVGHPGISFYAGVPVRAYSGEALGALCVIDSVPRTFSWQKLGLLKELARQIEVALEARQTERGRSKRHH